MQHPMRFQLGCGKNIWGKIGTSQDWILKSGYKAKIWSLPSSGLCAFKRVPYSSKNLKYRRRLGQNTLLIWLSPPLFRLLFLLLIVKSHSESGWVQQRSPRQPSWTYCEKCDTTPREAEIRRWSGPTSNTAQWQSQENKFQAHCLAVLSLGG